MILPARPLALRRAYLQDAWGRMLAVALGVVFATLLFVRVPVGFGLELLTEDRAFAAGATEVPVLEASLVRGADFGPFATFGVTVVTARDGVERFDRRGPFPVLFADEIPTSARGARAYRDPETGRVVTTIEHAVRESRWTVVGLALVAFGAPILLLLGALVGRAREHVAVRRAAHASDELLVDVDRERGGTIDYRVTSRVIEHQGGYRSPATPKRWLARYRQRGDERAPMVLSGPNGRRMVVLRTKGASTSVVVRDDYWPFVVDAEARLGADARAKRIAEGGFAGP